MNERKRVSGAFMKIEDLDQQSLEEIKRLYEIEKKSIHFISTIKGISDRELAVYFRKENILRPKGTRKGRIASRS